MRILAIDHFYRQDLDALQARAGERARFVRIPYQRIFALARRHFPDRVFADVSASAEPQYRANWASYRAAANRLCDWMLASHRPNLLVLPSDTIFYLRPFIDRFREAGLSTVVVQKETTISPMTMEIDSKYVAEAVPFMSDLMTVCSEHHREFWLRQGADPAKIVVTGQPRFDVYAEPAVAREPGSKPRLVYFSYDDFAYLPFDGEATPLGDWTDLRRATEEALGELAQAAVWEVVAKPHPQQISNRTWLGPGVRRVPADYDTRDLIRSADAVVGFQTTALFEAALAGKPVVYPAWGPVFDRAHALLVPFETYGDLVIHVQSRGELRDVLSTPAGLGAAGPGAREAAMIHLGPVDGNACERVLDVLAGFVRPAPSVTAPWQLGPGSMARGAAGPALAAAAPLLRRAGRPDLGEACERRADRWSQEWGEVVQIVAPRRGLASQ